MSGFNPDKRLVFSLFVNKKHKMIFLMTISGLTLHCLFTTLQIGEAGMHQVASNPDTTINIGVDS